MFGVWMLITVCGSLKENSGKTLTTRALAYNIREKGYEVGVFKPRSGANFWLHYDFVKQVLQKGRFYSRDAYLLRQAAGSDLPEEIINPVHRLWSIYKIQDNFQKSPKGYRIKSSVIFRSRSLFPQLMLERISFADRTQKDVVILNTARNTLLEDEELLNKLITRSEIYEVSSTDDFVEKAEELYPKAMNSTFKKISSKKDIVVTESLSNLACPWLGILKSDLVLVASPNCCILYEGKEFTRVIRALPQFISGSTAIHTDDVIEVAEAIDIVNIPIISKPGEKKDDELKPIFNDLLATIYEYIQI